MLLHSIRCQSLPISRRPATHQQIRHATLIRRPKRPYTFTQLVTLSDGSTFTHRTTSPAPVYTSQKDSRNTPLWNPSLHKVLTADSDEAGRLKAFRDKFGQGWNASARGGKGPDGEELSVGVDGGHSGGQKGGKARSPQEGDNLLDLISGYGRAAEKKGQASTNTDAIKKARQISKGGKR